MAIVYILFMIKLITLNIGTNQSVHFRANLTYESNWFKWPINWGKALSGCWQKSELGEFEVGEFACIS